MNEENKTSIRIYIILIYITFIIFILIYRHQSISADLYKECLANQLIMQQKTEGRLMYIPTCNY